MREVDKPVILLGSGGHAKLLLEIISNDGCSILGIITNKLESDTFFSDYKILGKDKSIDEHKNTNVIIANGLGFMPGNTRRLEMYNDLKQKNYKFKSIIHPSSIVSKSAKIFEGAQLLINSVVSSSSIVGENTIINTGATVDHDCIIEKNCHIAPGVICSGNVNIKENSFIGAGSVIIQGISIGKNCIVGAGSVVYKDLLDNTKYINSKK